MVEGGQSTVDSETAEIEAFRYAESPWIERTFGTGSSLPVLFPESGESGAHSSSTMGSNWAGAMDRGRSTAASTQNYTYGVEPGFAFEEGTEDSSPNSELNSDRGEPARDPVQEMENQQLFQQLLATESNKAEERGRGKGMELGVSLGREESARQLQSERDRLVAQAVALQGSFSEAREAYFHQLEQEAVKLALAIAARILRREAQMDPLLLTGAVRVALGQLAASTSVRLRVPAQDLPMWEETLARMPGLALRPEVIGETHMELGECRMETELGSADLGLWPQLKAIERGFFERPGDRSGDRLAENDLKAQAAESPAAGKGSPEPVQGVIAEDQPWQDQDEDKRMEEGRIAAERIGQELLHAR
jgi:flagellar biosynthesis/type III secretory pathway protein FliH